ncbi:hypothetical protein N7495_005160 [Penicillium taxi]|uniref:uncharacterized protein n=1 Tax=Penicillium taxi TaxID=168475 RepID=UPI002545574E|nr:uncharacterized protein N7495_005160 [Penicillium taxi]KAJ5893469.1 hypothetical protein N7495_005160 [Penicillium taxi]
MPYLPTSQAFLEQAAKLLEAYPNTTIITTKYSFPTETPSATIKRQKSVSKSTDTATATDTAVAAEPTAPVAALEFKAYNPGTGICLKYRTNKHQEVSRLMTGLGKLAGGPNSGDVEMVDAPALDEVVPVPVPAVAPPARKAKASKKTTGNRKN